MNENFDYEFRFPVEIRSYGSTVGKRTVSIIVRAPNEQTAVERFEERLSTYINSIMGSTF
jgi:hypothetical protein